MGQSWASRVQIGPEATKGTPVAATTILRVPFTALEDARDREYADEQLGAPLPSSRIITNNLLARLALPAAWATPEQLPYYLEMGIKEVQTGVADGDSSGFLYTYTPGVSAVQAIKTYTVETGDDNGVEEAEYCFAEQIVISGEAKKHVMMSANLIGRQVKAASFTGALSVPAVGQLLAGNSTISIDNAGGTFGATPLAAGNLEAFTLTIDTGRRARFTVDQGVLFFLNDYFDRDSFQAMLDITFEHDTTSINEKVKYDDNDGRLYRIDIQGDPYATPGTTSMLGGFAGLRIDFPGTYQTFGALEKSDGRTLVSAQLGRGHLSDTGEVLEIVCANELSALT